jgi:hypothetical protein
MLEKQKYTWFHFFPCLKMQRQLHEEYITTHSKEWNGARPVWSWWTTSSSPVHCPASSEISERRPHGGGKYQKGDWKDDDIIMSSLHGGWPTYLSEREAQKASWENWHSLTATKIPVFIFWQLRGLSPNFHIHVSVSDLYIPRIGPHISSSTEE